MKILVLIIFAASYSTADKIIGGDIADGGQFPSMAFQEKGGSFFCGAIIISSRSLLSAAHCQRSNFVRYKVIAGTTMLDNGGVVKDVVGTVVHQAYNSSTFANDIMILRVHEDFNFDDSRFPIATATIATISPADGTGITVVGWGDINEGATAQTIPNDLYFVEVQVIAHDDCNSAASYDGLILPGMICMGVMSGGKDSCQGDSGGPAYISGTTTVAGITSWGYGCAQKNNPGVYTDVAYFNDWISGFMS